MASLLATNETSTHNWLEDEIDEQDERLTDEGIPALLQDVRLHYDLNSFDSYSDQMASVDNLLDHDINCEPAEEDAETMIKSAVENMKRTPSKSCANCSKEVRIDDVSQIKVGQHLSMPGGKLRLRHFYKHHAIVKEIGPISSMVAELKLIHFYSENDRLKIVETTKEFDLRNDDLHYIKYEHPRYEPDVIVSRAEDILERSKSKDSPFKTYNLLSRNCEHFATWCVVGEGECLQVQGYRQQIIDGLKEIFGAGSLIARGVMRLVFNSADEIAAGFQGSLGAASGIALGVTGALYLLYCIVMTILYTKKYKNGNMCRSCLKAKLLDLWLGMGAFGVTSGLSVLLIMFVFPLLGPWPFGVPLVILIVLLSVALHLSISKIRRALQSPFTCDRKKISNLSEVNVGDIISFYYYGLQHVAVVTELNEFDHDVTCVHYALPTLFGTKIVKEETFNLNPSNKSIRLFDCNHYYCKPSHQVVKLARKRVGETKWSPVNRSDHLCYWAKVKENTRGRCEFAADMADSTTRRSKEAFIRKDEVHLMTDIELGDVVEYKEKGIVVGITSVDSDYGRQFELEMMVYNSSYVFCRRKYQINLNKDELKVFIYHPAFCFPMLTRYRRALDLENEKGKWWTTDGFIYHCIMLKHQ
ncbi:hypothetical protein ACF0H5_005280 [Mactra antiquata]